MEAVQQSKQVEFCNINGKFIQRVYFFEVK